MNCWTLEVGTIDTGYASRAAVTVEVEWTPAGDERFGQVKPNGCLSLVGTAQRPRARDCDECGQMSGTLRALIAEGMESGTVTIQYAPGWDAARLSRLLDVWDEYHLNDMQAGCEHQRELGWTYEEHPADACPVCGYKLGTAWKSMPVPDSVIDWLRDGAA